MSRGASAASAFLDAALPELRRDSRVVGVLAGGSWLDGSMDEWSDLDLVVVVEDAAREEVMTTREELAARLGSLLSSFTGEHVGEPRLLVCLYGPPLFHVDLKFVTSAELAERVEAPAVLWARDDRVPDVLAVGEARWPTPEPEWFEARFWIWVHYALTKLGRGELLEAVAMVDQLRLLVLGPLAQRRAGVRMRGMRHLERDAPGEALRIARTIARRERADLLRALDEAVALYRELREDLPPTTPSDAETPVVEMLERMAARP